MAEVSELDNTIVLKFGGSVLVDENSLELAVHEIYRWRRDGYRVVAVVSALKGETESLIRLGQGICPDAKGLTLAALSGLGEQKSAALLGLQLDRCGIPARVLTPAAIGLRCGGDPLNANPELADITQLEAALEQDGVVVIPGFIGVDQEGRAVTLGRGGSDSTAVFLASCLKNARCRLIKDVDGLYESDPATAADVPPARYDYANYAEALKTDGSIVQYKSINLASDRNVEVELGTFNGLYPSVIGSSPTRLAAGLNRLEPLRVAVCGVGSVGGGVLQQLEHLPNQFNVVACLCRTPGRRESLSAKYSNVHTEIESILSSDAEVVVELIGGTEDAYELVRGALIRGKHVVSANKALVAQHGAELQQLASEHGVTLRFGASVGGALPVLEQLRGLPVISVRGVLNGTSQYVLRSLERGDSYKDAVDAAQKHGYAEADPARDLDGRDALDKLHVIALQLGFQVQDNTSCHSPLEDVPPGAHSIYQIGELSRDHASVSLQELTECGPYQQLDDSGNLIEIQTSDGRSRTLHGRGAGRWPTATAVLGDLLELSRALSESDQVQATFTEDFACVS